MISPDVAFGRLLVALLIGFLIGLDRERAEQRKSHRLFAGVRTFPLIGLVGAVPMLIIDSTGIAPLIVSFLAVAGISLVAYLRGSAAGHVGATTEIAALATFLLGTLAGAGELLVAGAAGIAVAVLLVAKPPLERFSHALKEDEVAATLELAIISCIVLPLLPNRGFGPWETLNPFTIWLVVVLVSALSFAGFVAMRLLGAERGITIAGVVGALVSSTAVTVAMATRARDNKKLAKPAAAAAVLASAIMGIRVAVFAAAVGAGILPRLLPVILSMTAVGGLAGWRLVRHGEAPGSGSIDSDIRNPFSLIAALSFGGLYAAILLIVRAAQEYLGAAGMFVASGLAAIVDVDAISITLARGGPLAGSWRAPAAAVALALVSNTLVKLAIAAVMGSNGFRRDVVRALSLMALAGALVATAVFVWA